MARRQRAGNDHDDRSRHLGGNQHNDRDADYISGHDDYSFFDNDPSYGSSVDEGGYVARRDPQRRQDDPPRSPHEDERLQARREP